LNPDNHIDAVIAAPALARAIEASHTSEEGLKSLDRGYPPELIFPSNFKVECYHGRDRIEAARQSLFDSDRWWTVDLFLDSTFLLHQLPVCEPDQSSAGLPHPEKQL